MSEMSDYLENEVIKHIFRTGSFTKPATIYIGLYTTNPTDAGGGTEVSGNNYGRVQVGPSDATWAATSGTDGATSNVSAVNFPTPSGSWGTVTGFGIFDAVSAGNLLLWSPLDTNQVIGSGNAVSFAAGALDVVFA